jgi:tetratricopeptide (TPR) repeat protein
MLGGCAESSESPEVLVERGHLLEGRGQFPEAIEAYTKALDQRPTDATIYYDRGVAYGRLNRWSDAADDYTLALEHDVNMARAYNNRATAYAQQHQYDRAIADFSQAIKREPSGALSYRNRGLAYHDLGRLKDAIQDLTVAIGLDPNSPDGPFERGNAYLDARDFQNAISDFDLAIKLNPSLAAAYANRGEAYRQMHNPKQAQADIAKAKQLDPKIRIASLEQAPPPTKLAASPPETSAATGVEIAAEPPVAKLETVARREQAVRVAKTYLESKGYHVETSTAPALFDLACAKGAQRLRVEVQAPADSQSKLQLTRQQVEAIEKGDQPTALVVVGELENPTRPGGSFTRGKVIDFRENWKPDQRKLVPLMYEYPRP